MPIFSYRISVSLLHFLLIAQQIYKLSDVADPIALNVIMGNTTPSYIRPSAKHRHPTDDIFIWQDNLLSIDMTINDLDSPSNITAELMDRFFNAYGLEKNVHFNDKKELVQQK